jgi:type IV secretion system protein TrbL
MGMCTLPGVQTGCDLLGGAVGGVVGDAAGGVFDAAVDKITDGFATAIRLVVTFWTGVDVPGLSTTQGPVAELRANTAWLSAFIAVLSILACAGRMALTRSSRPAGEAFKGLLILVVVSGAGVAAVNALVVFGDGYSAWVLDRSTDGQLGERLALLATVGSTAGLGPGLILIVALLGMLASIAQLGLMLVRVGVVTIFAGLLPLAAAGTSTQTGMDYFKRMTSWLLAFVLYKPAAATVYACSFLLIGDGQDATSVLAGLFMLVLSIVALPAMLRLVTPMVGVAVAAGAGAGGGMAAAGMVMATGARMSAGGPSARGPGPAGGGTQTPGLLPGGASGPTGGAGGGAGAGAGAGGGPRPAFPGGGSGGAGAGAASAGAGAASAGLQAASAGVQALRATAAHAGSLDGGPAQPTPAQPTTAGGTR